jgi:crotonobetainyl-CoA:carnitine CoA-transferase CaiB-like acyl-CoA transferase
MEGIRILEVAQWTFVPAAGAVMADWGADVIKIEHPTSGDAQRGMRQLGAFTIEGPVNPVMEHANRGKRSIGLDVASEAGREILYEIARSSDVFLTNFLPATRRKLGIDVSDIQHINPSIIYARGSAYGALGVDGEAGGYDLTGFWCRGGSAASATPSDLAGVISQPGPAYGDSIGAMTIAGGIAAALLARERTGEAKVVDISLLGVGVWAMGVAVNAALQSGEPWRSGPAGANVAPSNPLAGFYGTSDGQYLAFSTLQAFRYWKSFCALISRSDLIDDERFATSDLLSANATDAAHEIRGTIGARPMVEWLTVLEGFDGQWSPVQSTLDVTSDQQVRANGMIVPVARPDGTTFDLVASPVQFDETPMSLRAAPEFAEHTEEILLELDRTWDQILELKLGAIVP